MGCQGRLSLRSGHEIIQQEADRNNIYQLSLHS